MKEARRGTCDFRTEPRTSSLHDDETDEELRRGVLHDTMDRCWISGDKLIYCWRYGSGHLRQKSRSCLSPLQWEETFRTKSKSKILRLLCVTRKSTNGCDAIAGEALLADLSVEWVMLQRLLCNHPELAFEVRQE